MVASYSTSGTVLVIGDTPYVLTETTSYYEVIHYDVPPLVKEEKEKKQVPYYKTGYKNQKEHWNKKRKV